MDRQRTSAGSTFCANIFPKYEIIYYFCLNKNTVVAYIHPGWPGYADNFSVEMVSYHVQANITRVVLSDTPWQFCAWGSLDETELSE
jgi:hypothetical protein